MKMQATTLTKARDLAIGFFGWFLFGNIGYLPFLFRWQPSLFMVPVITVVVIGVLFFMKRSGVGYGIATAVIVNTLMLMLLLMSFAGSGGGSYLMWLALRIGPSFPLPIGFLMALQGPF